MLPVTLPPDAVALVTSLRDEVQALRAAVIQLRQEVAGLREDARQGGRVR